MSSSWEGLESRPKAPNAVGRPAGRGQHDRKVEIAQQKQWPEVPKKQAPEVVTRSSRNGRFEISNVPFTEEIERAGPKDYPWKELAIGESFWIANRTKYRIRNNIPGKRFVSRRLTENGKVGIRVWRVK